MMIARTTKRTRLIILFCSAVIAGLAAYYFIPAHSCTGIVPYNAARDRASIIKLFHDNWYWLIADAERDTKPEESTFFSIERYLDGGYAVPSYADKRDETIVVYCVDNKTIGLISYYAESFYKGILHFIVVDPAYRGRGYAEKLVRYACDDMKRKGLSSVQLLTRRDNVAAQKLYAKTGFKEFWHDDRFVRFEKELV